MYNTTVNIVLDLFKNVDSDILSVSIVSTRYNKDSITPHGIVYTVTEKNGVPKFYDRKFVAMPDRNIRLRSFSSFFPLVQHMYQFIFQSLTMHTVNVTAVRYDIETQQLTINVPNNPSASNTAIATRNFDTRGSSNFSFIVTSV